MSSKSTSHSSCVRCDAVVMQCIGRLIPQQGQRAIRSMLPLWHVGLLSRNGRGCCGGLASVSAVRRQRTAR